MARASALLAGVVLLATADPAWAQTTPDPALDETAPEIAAPPAGQGVDQVGQATQVAGAQALTVQHQPTNVAVQVVVGSPGSSPSISQVNSAVSNAVAGNASSIAQGATQLLDGAGDAAGSAAGQAVAQAAQVGQDAGAQAAAVQEQAGNIAVQVAAETPDAAVAQANAAVAAAAAANTNATTQLAAQIQGGAAPSPSAPGAGSGTQPAGDAPASGAQTPAPAPAQLAQELAANLGGAASSIWIWIWNWNWTWNAAPAPPQAPSPPTVPSPPAAPALPAPPQLPAIPGIDVPAPPAAAALLDDLGLAAPFAGPTAPAGEATLGASSAQPEDPRAPAPRKDAARPATPAGIGALPLLLPLSSGLGSESLSSSFVQRRPDAGKSAPARLEIPESPHPSPGRAGAAGSAAALFGSAGLVLGALFLLALQLVSAAVALSRRFDLASTAWRRQAYLSPLERPG